MLKCINIAALRAKFSEFALFKHFASKLAAYSIAWLPARQIASFQLVFILLRSLRSRSCQASLDILWARSARPLPAPVIVTFTGSG